MPHTSKITGIGSAVLNWGDVKHFTTDNPPLLESILKIGNHFWPNCVPHCDKSSVTKMQELYEEEFSF